MPTKKDKDHKIFIKINNKISTGETKSKKGRNKKRRTKSYYGSYRNPVYNPSATSFYTGGGSIPIYNGNKPDYNTTPIQPNTNLNEGPKQEREKKLLTGNPLIDGMNKQGLNQLLIAGGEQPKPRAKRSELIKQVDNKVRKTLNKPVFRNQQPATNPQNFYEPIIEEAVANPHIDNFNQADGIPPVEEIEINDDNNSFISAISGGGSEPIVAGGLSDWDTSTLDNTVIIRDAKKQVIQTPSNKIRNTNNQTPSDHNKKYNLRNAKTKNRDDSIHDIQLLRHNCQ